MRTVFQNGYVYNSNTKQFVPANLAIEDGIISFVSCQKEQRILTSDTVIDLEGKLLAPGLIEIHSHGRDGGDFTVANMRTLEMMQKSYIASGVTTLFPTLASAPLEQLTSAMERISELAGHPDSIVSGIHLEGRYLSPEKHGAHNPSLLSSLDPNELEKLIILMKRAGHPHVSAALELDIGGSFSLVAREMGATLSLAHTNADYQQAQMAFDRGATALTHTYNAMPPLHHRGGGPLAAAFNRDDVFCELITDGHHVSAEIVRLTYKLKSDRLVLVTDSMEATGCPDGQYSIAGRTVNVNNGKATTHDGTLAGSTLNMLDAVKNLASFANIPFEQAIYNATAAPAKLMGIYDRVGSLDIGKQADMIVMDKDLNILSVWVKGNCTEYEVTAQISK